jgi:hypothetical protein
MDAAVSNQKTEMDIEISNVKDLSLQIQLTTLQLVITTLGARRVAKQNEITAIKDERGFRFGAEVEMEILKIELRGALEAEQAIVELFKSIAKNAGLQTLEQENEKSSPR